MVIVASSSAALNLFRLFLTMAAVLALALPHPGMAGGLGGAEMHMIHRRCLLTHQRGPHGRRRGDPRPGGAHHLRAGLHRDEPVPGAGHGRATPPRGRRYLV